MSTSSSTYQYSAVQRAALAVSAALAAWAEASARRELSAAVAREDARKRRDRQYCAELRRDTAINERLMMPRQF